MNRNNFFKTLFGGIIALFIPNVVNADIPPSSPKSTNDFSHLKDSFDDEDFKYSVKFFPIPLLEPLVNSVVEDMYKQHVKYKGTNGYEEKLQELKKLRKRRK